MKPVLPVAVARLSRLQKGKFALAKASEWADQGTVPVAEGLPPPTGDVTPPPVPASFGRFTEAAQDLFPPRLSTTLTGLKLAGDAFSGNSSSAGERLFRDFTPAELKHAVNSGKSLHQDGNKKDFSAFFKTATSGNGGGLVGQLNKSAVNSGDGPKLSFLRQNLGPILLKGGAGAAQLLGYFSKQSGGKSGLSAMLGCFSNKGGGLSDLFSSLSTVEGMSGLVNGLLPFLPKDAQKGLKMAMALASGSPAAVLGALAGFLPPELQKHAAAALPLLKGDLSGSLNALVSQYLPPELQGVWSTLQGMGGVEGLLKVQLPKLPSPFPEKAQPTPPAPPPPSTLATYGGNPPLAARVSDDLTCGKGKGPILSGESTVWIGGEHAARKTDPAQCTGPNDLIKYGEPSVEIGGLRAARINDPTEHGGTITTGFATVWIGKPYVAPKEIAGGDGDGKDGDGKDGDGRDSETSSDDRSADRLRAKLEALKKRVAELRAQIASGELSPEEENRALQEHADLERAENDIYDELGIDPEDEELPPVAPEPPIDDRRPDDHKPPTFSWPSFPEPSADLPPKPPAPTPPSTPVPPATLDRPEGGGATPASSDCSCDCEPPCRMQGTWEQLPRPANLSFSDFSFLGTYATHTGVAYKFEFRATGRLQGVLVCKCSCGKHSCRKEINAPFTFKMRASIPLTFAAASRLTLLRMVRALIRGRNFILEYSPELRIAIHEIVNSADRICQGLDIIEDLLKALDKPRDWFTDLDYRPGMT